jgi:nucleotide-binding universal stress UspA family protein
MKIVIAVDGSPIANKAARQAARLIAALEQAPMVIVLAVDPPLMKSVAIALGPDMLARYHADNFRTVLRNPGASLRRQGIGYEEKTIVGDPASSIAKFCTREKADLLVMGSHGRSAAKSLLLGSVAMKVLSSATIPIMIVR